MIEVKKLAADLYVWAAKQGILTPAAQREASALNGDPANIPFTQAEADFFRNRPINRIRTGGAERPIISVFTRQIIAERKRQQLTSSFAKKYAPEILLEITTAPSYKIDQTIKSYGRFGPVRHHNGRISCGSSIGLGNQRNAGTLTALAIDDSKQLFGLSCNHVVGGCNTALPGTPIVIPGIQDVTAEYWDVFVVGKHVSVAMMSQGIPAVFDISQNADLACFELLDTGSVRLTSWQGFGENGYDTPVEFENNVSKGMEVQKWGRSTGYTQGTISAVLTDPEPVEYNVTSYFGPQNSQTFRGTIYYPTVYEVIGGSGRPFSVAGDSGSLVVTVAAAGEVLKVVGIVIGGSTEKAIVLPLEPMLIQLKLNLLTSYP